MQTTMYIKTSVLTQVSRAAELAGISRSKMIIKLLKNALDVPSAAIRIGRLVQYQEREEENDWHTFHISFREDDYEFFQDLRKLLKMSLSLILADEVKKYFNNALKKVKNTDNYPHGNYVIIKEMLNTIVSWRLIWGFPPNIAQILDQSNNPVY